MKFITERGGVEAYFRFNVYNAFEVRSISGGLTGREPSRITHQLGKCDLEPKSGFPAVSRRYGKSSIVRHRITGLADLQTAQYSCTP